MKVLVCGGRDYTNRDKVFRVLDSLNPAPETIIAGGARGADKLAAEYAKEKNITLREFFADWKTHGKAAGPIRNQEMLDRGRPNLVIAFPGGRGTADMIKKSEKAGIHVMKISETVKCNSCEKEYPILSEQAPTQAMGCSAEVNKDDNTILGFYGSKLADGKLFGITQRPAWVRDGIICDECIQMLFDTDDLEELENGRYFE